MGAWRIGFRIVALLSLLLIGLVLFRLPLAQAVLLAQLDDAGLGPAAGAVEQLSLTQTRLQDVSLLDGALTIKAITLEYHWQGLSEGWLDRAEVSGLRLAIEADHRSLKLPPSLDALLQDKGNTPSGDKGSVPVLPVKELHIKDALARLSSPKGDLELTLNSTGRLSQNGALSLNGEALLQAPAPEKTGLLEASLTFQGEAESLAPVALSNLTGAAKLRVQAESWAGAPWPLTLSANGDIEATFKDQTLSLSAQEPILVSTPDLPPAWSFALPHSLRPLALGPLEAKMRGADEAPPLLVTLQLENPDPVLTLSGSLNLNLPDRGAFSITASSDLILGDQDNKEVSGPFTIKAAMKRAEAQMLGLGFTGKVEGQAALSGQFENGALVAQLDAPLTLGLEALPPPWRALVSPDQAQALGGLIEAELTGDKKPLTFSLSKAREARLSGGYALSINAEGGASFSLQGLTTLTQEKLSIEDSALRLSGLPIGGTSAPLQVETLGLAFWPEEQRGQASLATLTAPALSPLPLPLSLSAQGRLKGATLTFSLDAFGAKGLPVSARLEGRHSLLKGAGEARLVLDTLAFLPEGLQPSDLVPQLSGLIFDVSGEAGLWAKSTWTQGEPPSLEAEILLKDLSGASGFLSAQGINGVIRFDSLTPLTTPPGQRLSIAAAQAGAPLSNGDLTFALTPEALVVDSLTMDLAGGQIAATEARIPLGSDDAIIPVRVSGIDIGQLAALAEVEGLEATGSLSGAFPVTLTQGDLVFRNALLTTDGPGVLRYRSESGQALSAQGGSSALLWQALEDFQYKSLSLGLSGAASEDLELTIETEGANPSLYDGYPFALNFSVSGQLGKLLQDGAQGYQLPARIQQKMQEFGVKARPAP